MTQFVIERPPKNDLELWWTVRAMWGVKIPRTKVCEHHNTPFEAFADAYFARHTQAMWLGSRGFSGKSFTLSLLGLTEMACLGAFISILGGSGAQAQRVQEAMNDLWHRESAPRHLLVKPPTKFDTELTNGGKARTLMASQTSVRGLHPSRLRYDEVDESELSIVTAALGQTMRKQNYLGEMIETNTVFSSTHTYPDGPVTYLKRDFEEKQFGLYSWCYKDTANPVDGWLDPNEVERKRKEIPAQMWCFPAGQRVWNPNGTSTGIEHARIDVLSGDGSRRRVVKKWSRDVVDEEIIVMDVQGVPEPIRVTPNHEILTRDGWKNAGELTPYRSSQYNPATKLSGVGDMLVTPKRTLKEGGDFELGWFVGLYIAEGSIKKDGKNNRIDIACHEDEAELWKERLDKLSIANWYQHTGPGSAPRFEWKILRCHGRGRVLQISHRVLKSLLEDYTDLSQTARNKRLYELPSEEGFASGVLRGWIEGDGSVTKAGYVGITYSRDLATQMTQLATDLGYSANHRTAVNQGHSRNLAHRITISKTDKQGALISGPDCVYRRIKWIRREKYTGKVYDLEVAGQHTYVCGGVVVHNSNEYDILEPNFEGRAIDEESVERMFDVRWDIVDGKEAVYYQFLKPRDDRDYVTGVDWAKKKDFTVIVTWDTTVMPWKLAAFERINRRPWPAMIARLNKRWAMYGGLVISDSLGIGSVINDYIEYPRGAYKEHLVEYSMAGKVRSDMITEFVQGVENGNFLAPRVKWMYDEFRFVTPDNLYNYTSSAHLPDSIAATALAWTARKKTAHRGVQVISITRETSPWKI